MRSVWLGLLLIGCTMTTRRTRWYWDDVVAANPPYVQHGDGRLFGVDLSRYKSMVFVVDASVDMCGPVAAADNPMVYFESAGLSFDMDRIGWALADTIVSLPAETRFWIMVASGGSHLLLTPHSRDGGDSAAGRRRAITLAQEMMCHGENTGRLTFSLRRAFDLQPEVVVVFSKTLGSDNPLDRADAEKNLPEQRAVWADPVEEISRWPHVVPVIAIALGQGDGSLERLVAATGGRLVSPAW